jgi:hypothetical protein
VRKSRKPADFEKFYYAKVGLGEGCGCAERVIDVHEFERQAGRSKPWLSVFPKKGAWRRFMNKAGLTRRPKSRT